MRKMHTSQEAIILMNESGADAAFMRQFYSLPMAQNKVEVVVMTAGELEGLKRQYFEAGQHLVFADGDFERTYPDIQDYERSKK